MIRVNLAWLKAAVAGELVGDTSNGHLELDQVSTDTRTLAPGSLFIALKGPNFDAHQLVEQAIAAGAVAVLVDHPLQSSDGQPLPVPQIVVSDTRYALGQLGAAVKAAVAPKTIAITGSSGKTTVKEMLAAILAQRGKVLATAGNFNNDIGAPLTLLRLEPEHQFAVIELGANHQGEIAYTVGLTQPDVAIINNVAPAHVEGFGGIHGVYVAKSEIFRGLAADGLALTPYHSEFAEGWAQQLADRRHETFGRAEAAGAPNGPDVVATDIELDSRGCAAFTLSCRQLGQASARIQLNLPGLHNVDNALVAIRAALEVGCALADVQAALGQQQAVAGRLQVIPVNPQLQLIDDSYNANVGSVKAALDMLAVYPGQRVMVLGDMGELGQQARQYHEEIGAYAITAGIDKLFTVGVLSQSASSLFNGRGGRHFSTHNEVVNALLEVIAAAAEQTKPLTILVKGSRSARMEKVIQALQTQLAPSSSDNQEESSAC